MTAPSLPHNAYTNSPEMHPNLILGSLQLLFWLFFCPAAWRNHIARIDPNLRPDFCLAELGKMQWHNPALRRLLLQSYLVLPFLPSLLIGLSLWKAWSSGDIKHGVALGIAFGVTFSLVVSLVVGTTVSVAFGVVFSVMFGVTVSVVLLVPGMMIRVAGNMAVSVAISLTVGVVSGVANNVVNQKETYSLTRQTGGIVVGILLGGVAFGVVFRATGSAAITVVDMVGSATVSVALGVAIAMAIGVRTRHQWKRSVAVGIAVGVAVGVALHIMNNSIMENIVVLGVASGVVLGVFFAALFVLPYAIAERIAGFWAGAIAGALAGSGFWLGATISYNPKISITYICWWGLMSVAGGITLSWWRPVLLFPFTAILNTLLYRLEGQRANRPSNLLHYHSAFWDEYQRLPLLGLDGHIVLVAERNPAEGQAAIEYLSTSRQRWAAQAAQIELDARQLERCATTIAIGQIQQRLLVDELESPAGALFRSFNRISEDVSAALNQSSVYNQRLALTAVADRLDGLLRELTRSSDKYAVRFRPVAQRWCHTITVELDELTKAVEVRQEIDSPYIIGVPLTERQEIFVGRTELSRRIEQLLLDRRRSPLLLYGQRRTGKTSLLNNLGRLLPNSIIPMFVDLQGTASRASDHAGFLYNLAKGMIDSAKRQRRLILPRLTRESLTDDPFTRFDEWLDQVESALQDNTALLALDEFEVLDQVLAEGRFSETAVLGMLRNLIQHRLRFKVLLAGSHTLEEFQRWSSYLINAQVLHLSYLKESEARQLIEQPIEGFALRYESDASQRVLNLTHGHPFLVQLLCAEIVALKNEQDPSVRRLATLTDVEAAIPEALSSGSMFFSDIERNQVGANMPSILRYLAAQGEGATVSQTALASQFSDHWAKAINLLSKRELIEPTNSGYRFQVELIRRWFTL